MQHIIEGKLIVIGDVQTFPSGFQKREIVVETDGEYPQSIPIELLKNSMKIVDGYQVGQTVKVAVDLRGRESNGKYYSSIVGWKMKPTGQQPPPQRQEQQEQQDADDIPF